jgi:hypothetical protein
LNPRGPERPQAVRHLSVSRLAPYLARRPRLKQDKPYSITEVYYRFSEQINSQERSVSVDLISDTIGRRWNMYPLV